MRARCLRSAWRLASAGLALLVSAGLACALAGCGGVGISNAATGNELTIYASLPLQGPSRTISAQTVGGEKLALAQSGGRIGPYKIGYRLLDDSNTSGGQWNPGVTATNAKVAAQDTSTIAYLGDYDSGATAISLPLTNAAGILQVSTGSPYVGLTSAQDAGQDEPERFYPSGRRTFGRLLPGDLVEGAVQAQLMRSLGVKKLYVLDDQDPFEIPLAEIVAEDAARDGVTVIAHDSIATTGESFTGEVKKIAASGAQAVFFAGGPQAGTVTLWKQLHDALPGMWLLGSEALVSDPFTAKIGSAAAKTLLTTPYLPTDLYPPSAQRVLADYRHTIGGQAGPAVLYGYEAMSVVLEAIRSAGVHGNDRTAVIDQFFATRNRNSVLGSYSMQDNGETTLSLYGVDRVVDGRAAFDRTIDVH